MNLVTRSTGVVGIDFAMVWNLRGIYDRHSRDLGVVGIDFAMVWNVSLAQAQPMTWCSWHRFCHGVEPLPR